MIHTVWYQQHLTRFQHEHLCRTNSNPLLSGDFDTGNGSHTSRFARLFKRTTSLHPNLWWIYNTLPPIDTRHMAQPAPVWMADNSDCITLHFVSLRRYGYRENSRSLCQRWGRVAMTHRDYENLALVVLCHLRQVFYFYKYVIEFCCQKHRAFR